MEFQINFGARGGGRGLSAARVVDRDARSQGGRSRTSRRAGQGNFVLPSGGSPDPAERIDGRNGERRGRGCDSRIRLEMGMEPLGQRSSTPHECSWRCTPPTLMKIFLAGTSFRPEYGGPAYSVSRLAVALAGAGCGGRPVGFRPVGRGVAPIARDLLGATYAGFCGGCVEWGRQTRHPARQWNVVAAQSSPRPTREATRDSPDRQHPRYARALGAEA